MRSTNLRLGLLVVAAVATMAVACGRAVDDDQSVNAINLDTGERRAFGSEGAVPPGWQTCPDPACTGVLPPLPCAKLGAKVCELSPRCELKAINCMGSGCVQPSPTPGAPEPDPCPPPPPPSCEYVCVEKQPQPTCESITDKAKCVDNARCEWQQGPCPGAPCVQGQPCPPCPFSCRSKVTPPPPPPPPPCPTLPHPGPDFCKDGRIIPKYDQNKCIVGYTCEKQCPPIPASYPQCPAGQKVQPKYDHNGCVVGYECVSDGSCEALSTAYSAALAKAKVCQLSQMGPMAQCDVAVPNALACACTTYVSGINSSAIAELKKLKATWDSKGCGQYLACPAIACMAPQGGTCTANAAGAAGAYARCVDNAPTP
ncbi:MAG: hypothetical protein KC503_17995 [Myxococcales bacterium]|nr:hypothetical protein [Myxococcales bacterium]